MLTVEESIQCCLVFSDQSMYGRRFRHAVVLRLILRDCASKFLQFSIKRLTACVVPRAGTKLQIFRILLEDSENVCSGSAVTCRLGVKRVRELSSLSTSRDVLLRAESWIREVEFRPPYGMANWWLNEVPAGRDCPSPQSALSLPAFFCRSSAWAGEATL